MKTLAYDHHPKYVFFFNLVCVFLPVESKSGIIFWQLRQKNHNNLEKLITNFSRSLKVSCDRKLKYTPYLDSASLKKLNEKT